MRKSALFILFLFSVIYCKAQYSPLNPFKMYEYKVSQEDREKLALYAEISLPDKVDPVIAYSYVLVLNDTLDKIDTLIAQKTSLSYAQDDFDFLNSLNAEILELRKLRKELLKYRDFFESVNVLTGSPKLARSFFPIRTYAQSEFYYSKIRNKSFQVLNNIVIQGSDEKAVVVSDVLTGYFGVFRCNINTVFYNGGDQDTAEVLLDKIFSGGGLMNANISYPLFFRMWDQAAITVDLNLKGSADFNAFGSEIPKDEFIGYLEPSCNIYAEFALRNTSTSLFLNYKIASVFASDALNLEIGNTNNNPFAISQIYAGINLDQRIKISTNIPLININGLGGAESFTVGVQFFPDI